jgi:hypothetical protein
LKKGRVRTRAILAVAVLAGLWCLRVAFWRPYAVTGAEPADGYTRVSGVVHVHTSASDGGGTPLDVVASARAAGLGFAAITDHNTLDAKSFEGYRDGVLVIVGSELSTTAGHIVGLGIPDPAFRFSGDAVDGLADVRDLGGVAFAAHPTSARADFRWTGWDLPGGWGIEVLNGDSQWRAAGWPRLLRMAFTYPLNPVYGLVGTLTNPTETLSRWDALLARRDAPAIVGADAHARAMVTRKIAIPFPSYRSIFGLARNHVLLDRPLTGGNEDARAIVEALGRGRSYMGIDALAPADAIGFVAEAGGQHWTMGDTAPWREGLRLRIDGRMPAGAHVVVLKDGKLAAEGRDRVTIEGVGPGVYRAEIRLDGWDVPWVITNAITVADDSTVARRRAAAEWPVEPPAPVTSLVIDSFDAGSIFGPPQCDSASSFRQPLIDPTGGPNGSGAARLDFTIAQPTPQHPDVFCALVDERPRDLTGKTGIAFSIRGNGVYRVWFQVRDANPASADGGTEWWFTSVKTSTEWRHVTVPFARLRSINPKTDGRLDLDKVRALVFVVDKGAVKPGSAGQVWIDDLGAY